MTTFFIDRAMGSRSVADGLRDEGFDVVAHDEEFPPDARDVEWLPAAAENGWLILTKDKNIRYNASEKAAVGRTGAKVFTLVSRNLTAEAMIEIVVLAAPRIQRVADETDGGFIAHVYKSGRVKVMWPGDDT